MRISAIDSGYSALRAGRVPIPGHPYLLTWATKNRRTFLNSLPAARTVIAALRHADQEQWTETIAFVVMPDHVHWCIRLGFRKDLTDIVCSVKRYTSNALQRRGLANSRIWQSGYHDRALRSGDDLVAVSRYLVANPIRAGLVQKFGDYPHWDAVWIDAFIR